MAALRLKLFWGQDCTGKLSGRQSQLCMLLLIVSFIPSTDQDIDTNCRHALDTARPRYTRCPKWGNQTGVYEDGRSYAFIPGYANPLGAPFVTEANDRFASNVRRPPTLVVATLTAVIAYKLDHAVRQSTGSSHSKTVAVGIAVEFEVPRAYCTDYVS